MSATTKHDLSLLNKEIGIIMKSTVIKHYAACSYTIFPPA